VLADGQLGEPAAAIVAGHLSWPLEDPVIAGRFALLAAKEGEAPGSLVAVALGRPSTGPAAGTDRAVVVALQEMDAGTWAAASEGARYQALALRLLDDPAFVAALGEALVP
jgi:acyl transferase domain-containing protein